MRRVSAGLQRQDWTAVLLELLIVIVGVFIGTWVADWNQQRMEKRQVQGLVERLRPTLEATDKQSIGEEAYYATTRRYAQTALRGWEHGAVVSDEDFVVAAYQASQVTGFGANGQTFSTLIGADQVRGIDDPNLRNAMNQVLGYDSTAFSYQQMLTDYRQHVRELIPDAIQQSIREHCGDVDAGGGALYLPPTCNIDLPPATVTQTAGALRDHPELVKQLDYHLAQVSTFLGNLTRYDNNVRKLLTMIDHQHRPA